MDILIGDRQSLSKLKRKRNKNLLSLLDFTSSRLGNKIFTYERYCKECSKGRTIDDVNIFDEGIWKNDPKLITLWELAAKTVI